MLVLSRKPGQRVVIGDDITVVVLEVKGGRVKLGFECPREVPVYRREVLYHCADHRSRLVAAER
jgi:carbon storage regulator